MDPPRIIRSPTVIVGLYYDYLGIKGYRGIYYDYVEISMGFVGIQFLHPFWDSPKPLTTTRKAVNALDFGI